MAERTILIADDDLGKLKMMENIVRAAVPSATLHIARTARDALKMSAALGKRIDIGVIDFDFPGEGGLNGADIVGDLRSRAPNARLACATSRRRGGMFDEAAEWTASSGADAALCSHDADFETELQSILAAP